MPLKKGTPGKGGQGRVDSFSYTPVYAGLKGTWSGWLAGDPYWALAHEHTELTPGTKPCMDWMTDGAVRCKRCRPNARTTWIGWVPIYRESDGEACLVIVHESAMDLLHGLKYPQCVLVGRTEDISSVFVKKSERPVAFLTQQEQRKKARDITGDLVSMWQMPELEQWLFEQRSKPAPVETREVEEKPGAMTGKAAELYGTLAKEPDAKGAAYDKVRERLKNNADKLKPSTNGHHKPSE